MKSGNSRSKKSLSASSPSSSTALSSSQQGVSSGSSSSLLPSSSSLSSSSSSSSVSSSYGMLDYLQSSLPRSTLLQLYTDESRGRFVCRAVLQQLSSVSQQIVIRLSCCGGHFDYSGIQVWTTQPMATIQELQRWSLLDEVQSFPMNGKSSRIVLTEEFNKGLKECLSSLDTSPWTPVSMEQIKQMEKETIDKAIAEGRRVTNSNIKKYTELSDNPITAEDLERYTQTQWDAVLHFLVGTPHLSVKPSPAVIQFLEETGLMQSDPDYTGRDKHNNAPLVITQKGYDFMLQDNHQQVWHFVVQYLASLQAHSEESHKKKKKKNSSSSDKFAKEALLLLVCLGFARVGEPYSTSALKKRGRVMVEDLALFGLLLVRKIGEYTIFYPTRVALQLVGFGSSSSTASTGSTGSGRSTNSSSGGAGAGAGAGMVGSANSFYTLSSKALNESLSNPTPQYSSHLAIIVQTNFQLCAYTTSELHISMLGLFCDLQTIRRLPNVVFMVLTRDSVKAAFSLGIQAKQIIRFLEKHAHPKLRQNNPLMAAAGSTGGSISPIPSNVVDQLWLWDRERHRIQWSEVYSHQCTMLEAGEFQAVVQYARDKGAHAWSSESRKQLFIHYSHAEKVQNFVRQWRARTVARQAETHGM